MPSHLSIIIGKDNPILRQKSEKIPQVSKEVRRLIEKMHVVVREAKGIGLAAPQVGYNIRLILAQISGTFVEMINPEILEFSETTEAGEEGCLSLPGEYGMVLRSRQITVQFLNLKGETQTLYLQGMDARVVQHEVDHLDGILFPDRINEQMSIAEKVVL